MKKILLLPLLIYSFVFLNAQTDTVRLENNKTYTGSVFKNYTDRIILEDALGNEWMIYKERITSLNIRQRTQHNGIWGIEYFTDPKLLNKGDLPEYKDTKAYLKDAGGYGITSGTLIIGGGLIAAIGQIVVAQNSKIQPNGFYPQARSTGNGLVIVGSALSTVGTAFLIPAFVQLLKAGKCKTYRQPPY